MHNKKTHCPHQVGFTADMKVDRLALGRWCRDNCKGDYFYKYHVLTFHFEFAYDALRFKKHRNKVLVWQALSA